MASLVPYRDKPAKSNMVQTPSEIYAQDHDSPSFRFSTAALRLREETDKKLEIGLGGPRLPEG